MRTLLSDLIPLSQKRKLNLSSASSGASTVVRDGGMGKEVRQHCSKFFLLYPSDDVQLGFSNLSALWAPLSPLFF